MDRRMCTNPLVNIFLIHFHEILAEIVANRVWGEDVPDEVIYDNAIEVLINTQLMAWSKENQQWEICEVRRIDESQVTFQMLPLQQVIADDYLVDTAKILTSVGKDIILPSDNQSLSLYGLSLDFADMLYCLFLRIQEYKKIIAIKPMITDLDSCLQLLSGETLSEFQMRSSLFINTATGQSFKHIGLAVNQGGRFAKMQIRFLYATEITPMVIQIRDMLGKRNDPLINNSYPILPQPSLEKIILTPMRQDFPGDTPIIS